MLPDLNHDHCAVIKKICLNLHISHVLQDGKGDYVFFPDDHLTLSSKEFDAFQDIYEIFSSL